MSSHQWIPESTVGMRWLVPRMVRWAAKKELVAYSPEVVRPQLEKKEILHSDPMGTELFWQLCADNPIAQIGGKKASGPGLDFRVN